MIFLNTYFYNSKIFKNNTLLVFVRYYQIVYLVYNRNLKILNSIKYYSLVLFFSVLLFLIIFVLRPIEPNYFYCNEMKSYEFSFLDTSTQFLYPESCDQHDYHKGFESLNNLVANDYIYQARPLYIIPINLIAKLVSFFKLPQTTNLLVATFLFQNIIAYISIIILYKLIFKDNKYNFTKFLQLSIIVLLSPLFKWGLFDPSHQLLTLIVVLLFPYLKINNFELNFINCLLIGLLFLAHRSFLIGYIWLLFFSDIETIFKEIYLKLKFLFISFIPYLLYNFFFKFFLQQDLFDNNASYWGQFIWIVDFLRGVERYKSEWHCVTIPANFRCYFIDNAKTLIYLLVPLLIFLITQFLYKNNLSFRKNTPVNYLVMISLFLYTFWSFIGWYPPIRFSYYSIGNIIIILFSFQFFHLKDKNIKTIAISSYILYSLSLNHWNDSLVLNFNLGIVISLILLIPFFFITLSKYND